MVKITIIGAGNVGATCADIVARKGIAEEVVLIDIKAGLATGKALDLAQKAPIEGYSTRINGYTDAYEQTAGSEVVVITSGMPRKPGMSRDDLIGINAKIVAEVTQQVAHHSPQAVLIVVSNPLDVMTYQAHLSSGFPSTRVLGMAGVLDTARYRAFIAQALSIAPDEIQAMLLGGHGDTMVPLPRYTTVAGIPLAECLDDATIQSILDRTSKGGGELVQLMGTSAWYAPGAAAAQMAEAIVCNQCRVLPACVQLNGEYNIHNCYLGVPIVLGKKGVQRIMELQLNAQEKKLLATSEQHVREVMRILDNSNK